MHLAGPELSTTSYKKRKVKVTKAKQAEFEQGWRDRNVRLKEMGLPKETLEQYIDWVHGKVKKNKQNRTKSEIYNQSWVPPRVETQDVGISCETSRKAADSKANINTGKHSSWVTGACSSKPSPTYTGTKMIGVATMHKSNMVPVFTDDEAKDISSMRR